MSRNTTKYLCVTERWNNIYIYNDKERDYQNYVINLTKLDFIRTWMTNRSSMNNISLKVNKFKFYIFTEFLKWHVLLEVRIFSENKSSEGKKGFTLQERFTFFATALNIVLNTGAPVARLMHCWLMIKLKEQKEIGRKVREEEWWSMKYSCRVTLQFIRRCNVVNTGAYVPWLCHGAARCMWRE